MLYTYNTAKENFKDTSTEWLILRHASIFSSDAENVVAKWKKVGEEIDIHRNLVRNFATH